MKYFIPFKGLAYKAIEPEDVEGREAMMIDLNNAIRHYACSDCTMGLVRSFGYFGGKKARKMFLHIMRDEARGNSPIRPEYGYLLLLPNLEIFTSPHL